MSTNRQVQIAFSAVPGIGRKTFWKVLYFLEQHQISWSDFWSGDHNWGGAGLTEKQITSFHNFQQKFTPVGYAEYLTEKNIRTVLFSDKNYPKLLIEIDDRPIILYIKGGEIIDDRPKISVVGTRQITPYGEAVTKKLVRELVGFGVEIVSGFMYGVDVLAHETALQAGGCTTAVLGFGFEHIYPAMFEKKMTEMIAKGATFITEYPPFVQSKPGTFPERNRIVAGLSLGTLVTEAASESGTLITSGCAAEFGRSVFAVPGSIFSKYSEGTLALLNQGAVLVNSARDMVVDLGLLVTATPLARSHAPTPASTSTITLSKLGLDIVEILGRGPVDFDELVQDLGQPVSTVLVTLNQLEVLGVVLKNGLMWQLA